MAVVILILFAGLQYQKQKQQLRWQSREWHLSLKLPERLNQQPTMTVVRWEEDDDEEVGGWRQQQTGITYCLIHDEFSRYYKAFHIPANDATRRLTSSCPPPSFPSGPAYPPQCNFCGSFFCSADNQLTKHIRLTLSVLCLCGRDCLLHNGDPDSVSDNFQHMIYRNKISIKQIHWITFPVVIHCEGSRSNSPKSWRIF